MENAASTEAETLTTDTNEGTSSTSPSCSTEKTDMTTEIARLRMELEKQQEHIGEMVQSYDFEVRTLKERLVHYEADDDQSTKHPAPKRKREELDSESEQELKKDLHNARQEISNLNCILKDKDEAIRLLTENSSVQAKKVEALASGDKLLQKENSILNEKLKNSEKTIRRLESSGKAKDQCIEQWKQSNESLTVILQERETALDEALSREAELSDTNALKEEIEILQNERAAADAQISYLTEEAERYRVKIGEQVYTSDISANNSSPSPELIKAIDNIMTTKISDIHKKIDAVDKRLDEKLNQNQQNFNKSFAEAVSKNVNEQVIENVITHAKNDERLQLNEWQRREKNMILHGVEENGSQSDDEFVQNFLSIVGADVTPESKTRLGNKVDGRTRPLKLVMKSSEEKDRVMSRLVNLKNADDRYRKVSVRDDYSIDERNLIKQWSDKAAAKNQAENTTEYKVRGNPKNGLRLVRVTKRTTVA